jgi:hypothetical protein
MGKTLLVVALEHVFGHNATVVNDKFYVEPHSYFLVEPTVNDDALLFFYSYRIGKYSYLRVSLSESSLEQWLIWVERLVKQVDYAE